MRYWTPERRAQAVEMRKQGMTYAAIASAFGRKSKSTIHFMFKRHHLDKWPKLNKEKADEQGEQGTVNV